MVSVVLVIDMIKDFVTGKFENERAVRIVPNMVELLSSARKANKTVIYVKDSHPKDDHQFSIWGEHAVSGTKGSEIVTELSPEKDDYLVEKEKYSAFFGTDLDSLLENINVDEVILTGVLTHICIQHTAADAFYRGYEITVPEGCVEDLSDEKNRQALDFMKENYGAKIKDFRDLIEKW